MKYISYIICVLLLASCMGNNQENTSEDLGTPVSVLEIPESFT